MKPGRSLAQIKSLLEVISRTQAILIGGQAVNLWSERYQKEESPWKDLRPFTSVDVDLLGSQVDAKICAEATGGLIELPGDPAHTPNTAKVHCGRPPLDIDVLHTVNGLSTAEAVQTAVSLQLWGITLRVLHPVLCIESKAVNLFTLDQQAENRQDKKHLVLALANCHEFLREIAATHPHSSLVRWAERLRTDALSQTGLDIQRQHQLDFLMAVPLQHWQQTPGSLSEWVQHTAPQWKAEVASKMRDLEDIEAWLKKLKS